MSEPMMDHRNRDCYTELDEALIALTSAVNRDGYGRVSIGTNRNSDSENPDTDEISVESVIQSIDDLVDPPIVATVTEQTSANGDGYISVEATGSDRPYAFRGIVYARTAEGIVKASMSELRRMFMSSGDNLINSTSNDQKLTFNELITILEESGTVHRNNDNLAKSLELVNYEGKFNIQGQLLSDQNPAILTVAIFSGIDRTVISHRTEFSNRCLISLVRRSLDYVETLNETSVIVGEGIRKERKLFEMASFREAWINACVHNYWLNGTPPAIHIFDDRMEIISFGAKPYWLSDEDFFNGRSQPVNESLMRLFIRTGLAEHTGHGVPIIVQNYGRGCFSLSNSGVTVTIPFSQERSSASLRKQTVILTDAKKGILDSLKTHPKYTLTDVAESTGLSRSYVGKTMMKLKDLGLVMRIGSNKSGLWKVTE